MKFHLADIVKLSVVSILCVAIAGVSQSSLFADTDVDRVAELKGWVVSVSPASFSYDDEITVSLSGLPKAFPFQTGSVTMGGVKVHVPTPVDAPDPRLLADDYGNLVFKTNAPAGLGSGSKYLKVDIQGVFVARTPVDLRPLTLRVSSQEIVPHQEVWILGMGFTKIPSRRGKSPITVDEMTGSSAGVTIGGKRVLERFVEFPVMIGRNGSMLFKMIVPEMESTTTPGPVELRVTDSKGREGTVTLTVPTPKLDLSDYVSYPGENVPFTITGLPARRAGFNNNLEVVYRSATDLSGTKFVSVVVGSFAVDEVGRISGRFDIPRHSLLSSPNEIWVTASNGEHWEFDHYLAGRSIELDPASGLPGDPVKITIKGAPRGYVLAVGTVSLGETQMDVPGWFGVSGSQPISDDIGFLTFESAVPNAVQPGSYYLNWNAPGGVTVSTTFHVAESALHFDPPTITPGQMVRMTSTPRSTTAKRQRITGNGASYVFLDGLKQRHDVVNYPIPIDADGSFETTFRVPVNTSTAGKDSVQVTTLDTLGRFARGTLYLKRELVTITPAESVKGTVISVEGTGFFSNVSGTGPTYRVLISYGGVEIGSAMLDESGAFRTSIHVPSTAVVGADNTVSVMLEGRPSVRVDSNHKVPNRAIQVTPGSASSGEIVSVIGAGFDPFRQVTIGLGHLWASNVGPRPFTDKLGGFEISVEVPRAMPKISADLTAYIPYPYEVASVPFQVK